MAAPVDANLRAALQALPKIELHRHLEGALRLTTLLEVARRYELDLPLDSPESLRPLVQVTNDQPGFRNFLDKFNVLRRFYQAPEVIQRLAYEVVDDAAHDNIRYLELRFTPYALASTRGYALSEVFDWVIEAVQAAVRDHPALRVGLIASVNRHESLEIAEQVTRLAIERRAQGIVGLDLAGDEVNYTAEPFRPLFRAACEAGLGVVAHAGEWTGAETVRDAILNLGVQRVGHGVRVLEDPDVVALALERGTVFEVCLTSNVQTGVVPRLADHPLGAMQAAGLRVTINTDDPSVSASNLTDEYALAAEHLGFTLAGLQQSLLTAAASTFLPPAERAALVARFEKELAA
jgi:adenosine deaminase